MRDMQALQRTTVLALALLAASQLVSCRSAYYATMEQFGVHKRDILVDRVKEGRDAQTQAKEEIVSALDAFKQVANFDGGDLERVYSKLQDEYESSADAVDDVKSKIRSIETVSNDLFLEWKSEIGEMHDADLRRSSEEMLHDTRARYATLIGAMKAAESKMEPVLVAFKDHVLFLKHNLNAKAVASLQNQLVKVEANVGALISEMEKSIAEADAFIAAMSDGGSSK
jgi:predicted  nucleic acid-binding Zn-ribbon protein